MADTSLSPPHFNGTAVEDAEAWIRQFRNYCAYKEYTDGKKLSLMKVLLSGAAATWLESLGVEETDTWEHLHEIFRTRYTTPSYMKFKSAKDLFNTKQLASQSVDDYVAHMQQLAKFVGAEDKMVLFAILNGLRPEISSYVTQKQPKDVRELLDHARVGEMTSPISAEKDTATSVQLALVQDQLRELTTRLDKPTASSATTRTPSPRRVRFENERSRYDRCDDRQNDRRRPTESPYRRFDSPRRYQPRSPPPGRYQGNGFMRGGGAGRFQQGRGYGGQSRDFYRRPPPRNDFQQFEQCSRCGGGQHESFNQCPAVNKSCMICGKRGHFGRMCRTGDQQRRQQ